MNKDWQKAVRGSVGGGVADIISQIRESNPEAEVRANYKIHYPEDFLEGENAIIPVSAPSKKGPVHVADIHLDINEDMYIVGVRLAHGSFGLYDGSQGRAQLPPSLKKSFDIFAEGFSILNSVMNSQAMKALLIPNVGGVSQVAPVLPGSGEKIIGPRQLGSRVPLGNRGPTWHSMQMDRMEKEDEKIVQKVKTPTERETYIKDCLGTATKSPGWYYALGGRAKEQMRDKIVTSYLQACAAMKETIPSAQFFDKLTEKMATGTDILPYCERVNEFIAGTASGKCKQTDCQIYKEVGCPKFSFRLNHNKKP